MRMIDADAMRQDWLENGENEHIYDTNAVLDSIDQQPTIDAVVLPCHVGDKLQVDANTLPLDKIAIDDDEIPDYFSATVVSIRQNTKGWWIKFSVWAPWLVWIRDDECGDYEAGVEMMRYFTVPASAIGKTVFLYDGERRSNG